MRAISVAEFLTAIYRKSRGDLFIGGYKKGEQRVGREKEMMRELGGWGKVRFDARNEEAHKIGRFGTRMKMKSRMSSGCRAIFIFLLLRRMRARYTIMEGVEREGERERGGEERSTNAVKYHSSWCRIRFTAISFAICRSWASLRFREKLER